MNVVFLFASVIYLSIILRRPRDDLAALKVRLTQDIVDVQVDPSWLVSESRSLSTSPIEQLYLVEMKNSLLRGESLLPALNGLHKVLTKYKQSLAEQDDLRKLLYSKLIFQLLLLSLARLLLGSFWLVSALEFVLIVWLALAVWTGIHIFERLLPKSSLCQSDGVNNWVPALFTAAASMPDFCPGIREILTSEQKAGIGRRQTRLELIVQHLINTCKQDSQRTQRFSDSLVIFELSFAALLVGGLLSLPLLARFF